MEWLSRIAARIQRKKNLSLPLQLKRQNIYIFPNRFGLFFIVVIIAMLIGSVNYQNNLGYLMTFLLSAMLFMSLAVTFRTLHDLEIQHVEGDAVFAKETAHIRIRLINAGTSRFGITFLLDDGSRTTKTHLTGGDHIISVPVITSRRERIQLKGLTVETTFPMGLIRCWAPLPILAELIVYPSPRLSASTERYSGASVLNEGGGSGTGVDDFKGLDQYQPGDSPQRIAWKTVSRGQGVFTKSFEGSQQGVVMFDWFSVKETSSERRLEKLAYMIQKSHASQRPYGLILPGLVIQPDISVAHRHTCLSALTDYNPAWPDSRS